MLFVCVCFCVFMPAFCVSRLYKLDVEPSICLHHHHQLLSKCCCRLDCCWKVVAGWRVCAHHRFFLSSSVSLLFVGWTIIAQHFHHHRDFIFGVMRQWRSFVGASVRVCRPSVRTASVRHRRNCRSNRCRVGMIER